MVHHVPDRTGRVEENALKKTRRREMNHGPIGVLDRGLSDPRRQLDGGADADWVGRTRASAAVDGRTRASMCLRRLRNAPNAHRSGGSGVVYRHRSLRRGSRNTCRLAR